MHFITMLNFKYSFYTNDRSRLLLNQEEKKTFWRTGRGNNV